MSNILCGHPAPCYTLTGDSVFALVLLQTLMSVRRSTVMPNWLFTDAAASLTHHTHKMATQLLVLYETALI